MANRAVLADRLNAMPGFPELMCQVATDRLNRAVMRDGRSGKVCVRLVGEPSRAEVILDHLLAAVGLPTQLEEA